MLPAVNIPLQPISICTYFHPSARLVYFAYDRRPFSAKQEQRINAVKLKGSQSFPNFSVAKTDIGKETRLFSIARLSQWHTAIYANEKETHFSSVVHHSNGTQRAITKKSAFLSQQHRSLYAVKITFYICTFLGECFLLLFVFYYYRDNAQFILCAIRIIPDSFCVLSGCRVKQMWANVKFDVYYQVVSYRTMR